MAAPQQQHPDWVTWTRGHSQRVPQTRGPTLLALICQSSPLSVVPSCACAHCSHLKHRGGLCCYCQPYIVALAIKAVRAEDVSTAPFTLAVKFWFYWDIMG